jgi:2,3-bisphosphoglycerate-independent phosphoglycerate mutase
MKKTKILCIFDGFGIGLDSTNNCITRAKMPNFRRILKEYYWTTLNADGESVGQEAGLVGNSEVGHMNIGGLQLVPQLSYQITKSAEDGYELDTKDKLFSPKKYLEDKFVSSSNKTVHLVGLFSTGTIHSDMRHWIGSIEAAGSAGANKIILHLITDGRDSDRQSLVETWQTFVAKFETRLQPFATKLFLGSVGGRFFGMDRDKNWNRVLVHVTPWLAAVAKEKNCSIPDFIKQKYSSDVLGKSNVLMQKLTDNLKEMLLNDEQKEELENTPAKRILEILNNGTNINLFGIEEFLCDYSILNYKKDVFDETLIPACLHQIQPNDTIWLLNFRSDRTKQIMTVLCDLNNEFQLGLDILGMNDYGIEREFFGEPLQVANINQYKPIFQTKLVQNTLAETISNLGQTQLHIAETEKYAHVTYFLNGGNEVKHPGENWIVIPSNKVESHAEKPEMKAKEITDYILDHGLNKHDFVIVNYANPDMVGHTGDIDAGIRSMEFLDEQFGRLLSEVEQGGHSLILIADHGNMEFVGEFQKSGKNLTDTEHNPNAVPCVIVDNKFRVNADLESNINTFLEQVKNSDLFNNLNIDFDLLQTVLQQKNYKNLDDNWLSKDEIVEITKTQLPLWYAGFLLLGLMLTN